MGRGGGGTHESNPNPKTLTLTPTLTPTRTPTRTVSATHPDQVIVLTLVIAMFRKVNTPTLTLTRILTLTRTHH